MVNEIADRTSISKDAARQRIMDSLGGPRKLPNWSHSWHLIELLQLLEASTSSMAGQSRPFEAIPGLELANAFIVINRRHVMSRIQYFSLRTSDL
jgi:hypothetical protein